MTSEQQRIKLPNRSDDDLAEFQATLLPLNGIHAHEQAYSNYTVAFEFAKIPLRLSAVCRQVHSVLTGPKARQSDELNIHVQRLHDVWNSLGHLWEELENLRQLGTGDLMKPQEVERYVNGWQVSRSYRRNSNFFKSA